jgi:hypothetical protein
MMIPVAVQLPNQPLTLSIVGEAPEDCRPEEAAHAVGILAGYFIKGVIDKGQWVITSLVMVGPVVP